MKLLTRPRLFAAGAMAWLIAAPAAFAHHLPPGMEEVDEFGDETFMTALKHPFTGIDHLLAALAIGLIAYSWGKKVGLQSIGTFVAAMLGGLVLGRAGIDFPMMEQGLALSVVICGCVIAGARFIPKFAMLGLAALVGLWHGCAHGLEMPVTVTPSLFAIGLCLGSAGIALTGNFLCRLFPHVSAVVPRLAGGGFAAVGTWLFIASLG